MSDTISKQALQKHIMKAMQGCLRAGDDHIPAIRELRSLYDHIERGYFNAPSNQGEAEIIQTAKEALSAVVSVGASEHQKLKQWSESVEKEARQYLIERNDAREEIARLRESKKKHIDVVLKLQDETIRLREALGRIAGYDSVKLDGSDAWIMQNIAIKALSSHIEESHD